MKKLILIVTAVSCVAGCAGVNPNAVKVECNNATAIYGTDKKFPAEQEITTSGILITKEDIDLVYYMHPDIPLIIQNIYWTGYDHEIKFKNAKLAQQRVYIVDPELKIEGKTFKQFVEGNKDAYNRICNNNPVPTKELLNKFAGVNNSFLRNFTYKSAGDIASQKYPSLYDRDYLHETQFQAILEKHLPGYDGSLIVEKPAKGKPVRGISDGKVKDPVAVIQAFLDKPEKQAALDADLAEYFGRTAENRAVSADYTKRKAALDKRSEINFTKMMANQEKSKNNQKRFGMSASNTAEYSRLQTEYDLLQEESKIIKKEQDALEAERKAKK